MKPTLQDKIFRFLIMAIPICLPLGYIVFITIIMGLMISGILALLKYAQS